MKIVLQNKELEIKHFERGGKRIAEVSSKVMLISDLETGTALLVDIYYQGFDKIILDEKNICTEFFDLKSGFAGEILQTVSNFR